MSIMIYAFSRRSAQRRHAWKTWGFAIVSSIPKVSDWEKTWQLNTTIGLEQLIFHFGSTPSIAASF
jgi:hypothetical protein